MIRPQRLQRSHLPPEVLEHRRKFVKSVLNKPWKLGHEGPDSFDCWGLFRHTEREVYGIEVPMIQLPKGADPDMISAVFQIHPIRNQWVKSKYPTDGCAVLMYRQIIGHHIGVFIGLDEGVVLHCVEGASVQVDSILRLKAPPQCWTRLTFYVPKLEAGQ